MSRALVTGGAGFIGSHIVEALMDLDHEVTILDDLSTGNTAHIEAVKDATKLVEGDLLDDAVVEKALDGVDYVFHTAACASVNRSIAAPQWSFRQNVVATVGLLNACRRLNIKRFIFSSSSAIYGFAETLPVVETHSPKPASPYAMDKVAVEQYLRLYAELYDLDSVALRYFNVYGPRQNADDPHPGGVTIVINQIRNNGSSQVLGDGNQTRDMVFIKDVVAANIAAMNAPERLNGVGLNVCTGKFVVITEMHEKISELMGIESIRESVPCPGGNIVDSAGDPGLAKERIGFEARTSLEDGLRKTIDWSQ